MPNNIHVSQRYISLLFLENILDTLNQALDDFDRQNVVSFDTIDEIVEIRDTLEEILTEREDDGF